MNVVRTFARFIIPDGSYQHLRQSMYLHDRADTLYTSHRSLDRPRAAYMLWYSWV